MKGECLVKEIQMKNFRSLKDTEMQPLSPITILVGENSSGKSTFLRAFPLLKQSISKRTSGPILWAGDVDDYVDFGSFEETVTNDGSDDITFGFKFSIDPREILSRHYSYSISNVKKIVDLSNVDVHYDMKITSERGRDRVTEVTLGIGSFRVVFDIGKNTLTTNGGLKYCVPSVKHLDKDVEQEGREYFDYFRRHCSAFGFELPVIDELWRGTVDEIIRSSSRSESLFIIEASIIIGAVLFNNNNLADLSIERKNDTSIAKLMSDYFSNLSKLLEGDQSGKTADVFRLCFLYDCFMLIDDYIYTYFKHVHYIAPLRATAERYYRLRNLAVDEVDYQGKNLPIFINSLTDEQLKQFQIWTDKHFGFTIDIDKSRGHLSLLIQLRGSDKKINLSDTGFGYSQVLPIITQMWELAALPKDSYSKDSYTHFYSVNRLLPLVIAIEQPELHLHPAIQAKLAKAFIACIDIARKNKRELQLIIETHSETIVNYFGRAIARKQLDPNDVSVIIFEKNVGDSVTEVQNSYYNKYGMLTNWPYGFFESEE